jgi:hypothetical protein
MNHCIKAPNPCILSLSLPNMNGFSFLVLMICCHIVTANHVYHFISRKRYSSSPHDYYTISQDRNLARIRSSDSLNILGSDHYGYDGGYNRDMCGYMGTHVYINGANRDLPVSESVKRGFIEEYFARIYTPVNFPLTYRKEGVYIDGNHTNFDKVLSRYYYKHCVKPKFSSVGVFIILIFMIIIFIGPAILLSRISS